MDTKRTELKCINVNDTEMCSSIIADSDPTYLDEAKQHQQRRHKVVALKGW